MHSNTHFATISYKGRQSQGHREASLDQNDKNFSNIKANANLAEQLEQEKAKRQDLEKQLGQWKRRLIDREAELRAVIAKMDSHKGQARDNSQSGPKVAPFVVSMHQEINQRIEEAGTQNAKWLEGKQKMNIQNMDRKLQALKKQMEEKISTQKILTLQSLKSIMAEIEDVRTMGLVIDNQNKKLLSEVKQLRIRNKILAEERNIAISDNVTTSMRLKQMRRLNETKTPLFAESKNSRNHSRGYGKPLTVSQQIPRENNRFLGEPIFDSPKQKRVRIFNPTHQDVQKKSIDVKEHRSILSLQRTLKRQKRKNYQMNTLFAQSSKRNSEINDILWESMDRARKEAESNSQKTFNTCVVDNLLRSQGIVQTIQRLRDSGKTSMPQPTTVDLSDLQQIFMQQ